jgi:hypothetical protein
MEFLLGQKDLPFVAIGMQALYWSNYLVPIAIEIQ